MISRVCSAPWTRVASSATWGLTGVDINVTSNGQYAGALAGYNAGKVAASYAVGWLNSYGGQGGLVGDNQGEIIAGYANVTVVSQRYPGGGLAGRLGASGKIIASYALGRVQTPQRFQSWQNSFGGLVGDAGGEVTDSYYAMERGQLKYWAHDNPESARKMSWDLYTPTSAAGIYAGWDGLNVDDTSGTVAGVETLNDNSPWDFGTALQYPVLVFGGDAGSELARRSSQQEAHPGITWTPTVGRPCDGFGRCYGVLRGQSAGDVVAGGVVAGRDRQLELDGRRRG